MALVAPVAWHTLPDMAFIQTFWLIVMRLSGVFITAPLLNQTSIPALVKTQWALILAFLFTGLVPTHQVPAITHEGQLLLLAVQELGIGALLGMAVQLVVLAFQMAGELMAIQIGLNMAGLMDPVSRLPSTALANLLSTACILAFIGLNGHHWIIASVAQSLYRLPPGCGLGALTDGVVSAFMQWPQQVFTLVLQLVLPVLGIMLLLDVTIGYLAKSMPQLNLMTLTPPLKILLGISLLGSCLPGQFNVLEAQVNALPTVLQRILPIKPSHLSGYPKPVDLPKVKTPQKTH
jgi:flagellar biosynthetic protein FliR